MKLYPSLGCCCSSLVKVTPSTISNSGSASKLRSFEIAPTPRQYPRDVPGVVIKHCLKGSSVAHTTNRNVTYTNKITSGNILLNKRGWYVASFIWSGLSCMSEFKLLAKVKSRRIIELCLVD